MKGQRKISLRVLAMGAMADARGIAELGHKSGDDLMQRIQAAFDKKDRAELERLKEESHKSLHQILDRRFHADMTRKKNPLKKGYSRETISANIATERRRGRSAAQSEAMAYRAARKSWRERHPRGQFPDYLKGRKVRKANPERIAKEWLVARIKRLANAMKISVSLHKHHNGMQIKSADGSEDYSPILSAREMDQWLRGAIWAAEFRK